MAIIDSLLPLSTFVCFMGGNSGQTVIQLLRCHPIFVEYDRLEMDDSGAWQRRLFMPITEKQFLLRLPFADLLDKDIGRFSFLKSDDTKLWLRQQTEEWLLYQWNRHALLDLDQIITQGQRLAFPTHLDPWFLDWVMPEARKIFVTDHNSYFAVRADQAKNPNKHPTRSWDLVRYLAQRVSINRTWNTETDFPTNNAVKVMRSDLIGDSLESHQLALGAIFDSHGLSLDAGQQQAAWQLVCKYQSKQKRLNYISG